MRKVLLFFFCISAASMLLYENCAASDWTFMVYLDADNNLEAEGIDDFLEMASVGSDSNTKVVVQFDRIPGYDNTNGDWQECQRFLVSQSMTPTVENAVPDWGDGLGGREVNMADPQTLIDFVKWAMDQYPADNYALVFWNHGGGWRNERGADRQIRKSVCWDDTSEFDALHMSEVKEALSTINDEGDLLDLVGFDACLMGMIEVAYDIRDLAHVMVASEESEPDDGWPYETILADLVNVPTMTPLELGATIVDRYGETYPVWDYTTQSAIDLNMVEALATAINDFAAAIMDADKSGIAAARSAAQEYDYPEHIDLYHFSELLSAETSATAVANAAYDVMLALEQAVTAEYHGYQSPNSHGLAIYFPEIQSSFDSDYTGSTIDFPGETQWDDFLHWYYGTTMEVILLAPDDGTVLSASIPAVFEWNASPDYRFKIQFSPSALFVKGFPTLSIPRQRWMRDATTTAIPELIWQNTWNRLQIIEQKNGIVYWRVLGKTGLSAPPVISEVRSFTIE